MTFASLEKDRRVASCPSLSLFTYTQLCTQSYKRVYCAHIVPVHTHVQTHSHSPHRHTCPHTWIHTHSQTRHAVKTYLPHTHTHSHRLYTHLYIFTIYTFTHTHMPHALTQVLAHSHTLIHSHTLCPGDCLLSEQGSQVGPDCWFSAPHKPAWGVRHHLEVPLSTGTLSTKIVFKHGHSKCI